jgi:serine/threonine-protein kinase
MRAAAVPDDELFDSRYEVLRTVSEGRRATVLQAIDRMHDELVALKVYPITGEDRDALLAEARLLRSIDPHPGLPAVRGDFYTEDDSRYVVVMNWVDGTDLQQSLEEQGDPGLRIEDVIVVLEQVAIALDHLHHHEPPIVHGDVKPANVVQAQNGHVVLVDFDIAGAQAGHGRLGTIGYVAPEVAAGEKPGPAADVFGLAATAVTLLNGRSLAEADPTYSGIEPARRAQVARVLRTALSVDPARRPRSATRLVEKLRDSGRVDQLEGVVALLATEVADAERFWSADRSGMQAAMDRLGDMRDAVVDHFGGRVVTTSDEDPAMAVFREASKAALAALELHDRIANGIFPPGVDVRLRAAVEIGEGALVGTRYTGAVVDRVRGICELAAPGATVTSDRTAELLVDLVEGDLMSLVPLDLEAAPAFLRGASLVGLTRPGAEDTVAIQSQMKDHPDHRLLPPLPVVPEVEGERDTIVLDALQHPTTLVALTVVGFALIFLVVLSPELGMAGVSAAVLVCGAVAFTGFFAWHYSHGYAVRRQRVDDEIRRREDEQRQRDAEEDALNRARERAETRRRLQQGFSLITSEAGDQGETVLAGLGDEFDAIAMLLERSTGQTSASLTVVPNLTEEAYRHGMSALSRALELLEIADGPQRRRIEGELAEIDDRLERDAHADERAKARDDERQADRRRLLGRLDDTRGRAGDLMYEAERCATALAVTRLEIASLRADDTHGAVGAVVETLETAIQRVRDVQDELRRLGY